jgi:SAM-dependent methyltransferase
VTNVVNTHQSEAWNGYEGQHWADEHERYNTANGGMNRPLLTAAAIGPTDHVLDIGCGTGHTTRLAAALAAAGHVTGIDLSGPMLARARAVAEADGIGNVTYHQGDAQVYPLLDNGFDVAISRGGIMFFDDPVAAFGNVNRALRPGGRLAFVCPKDTSMGGDFANALAPLWRLMSRHAKRVNRPGPTSLGRPERITEVLTKAGLTGVDVASITVAMAFGQTPADAVEFVFAMGPMRFNLEDVPEAEIDHVRAEVTETLRPYHQDGQVRLSTEMWLVTATAGPQ